MSNDLFNDIELDDDPILTLVTKTLLKDASEYFCQLYNKDMPEGIHIRPIYFDNIVAFTNMPDNYINFNSEYSLINNIKIPISEKDIICVIKFNDNNDIDFVYIVEPYTMSIHLDDDDIHAITILNDLYNKFGILCDKICYNTGDDKLFHSFSIGQLGERRFENMKQSVLTTNFCKLFPKIVNELNNSIAHIYLIDYTKFESEESFILLCKRIYMYDEKALIKLSCATTYFNGHALYEDEKYFSKLFYNTIINLKTEYEIDLYFIITRNVIQTLLLNENLYNTLLTNIKQAIKKSLNEYKI